MRPCPKFDEIKRELLKFAGKGTDFSGVCFRCTQPEFASQIVSGAGSQKHGARWTPKGSFPTVYLCETAEAALQEYLARGRRLKLPDHEALPMVMAGVEVRVKNLLDMTNREIAEAIRPLLDEEKVHWRARQDQGEAVSQAIGRAIQEICFSGLIAPSQALPNSRNIVIFPQKLGRGEALAAAGLESVAWK